MMKYSRLDEAQNRIEALRAICAAIRRNWRMWNGWSSSTSGLGMMQAVDIFFDNIFSDWMVGIRSSGPQNEMYGLQRSLSGHQDRRRGAGGGGHQLSAAQADLDRLVSEA